MEQQENYRDLNQNYQQSTHQQRASNTTSPPATSASSVPRQRTAEAGLPRRRIRWTHDMNVSVLKAYYQATRNNSIIGYRQQMHSIFLTEYPELSHLTQQNLADRRAAIIRNNLIPITLQEEIRQRVINEYNQANNQQDVQTLPQQHPVQTVRRDTTQTTQMRLEVQAQYIDPNEATPTDQTDELISKVKSIFNEAKIKFLDMTPGNRPYLPKQNLSRKLYQVTSIVNTQILPAETPINPNYQQIIGLIYCCAYTISQTINHLRKTTRSHSNQQENITLNTPNRSRKNKASTNHQAKPYWLMRIHQKIEELRRDLGFITSYMDNKVAKRKKNKLNKIKRRYYIHTQFDPPNLTMEQIRDTIKQKLAKYSTKLKKYTKSYNRAEQNKLFKHNEKKFYNTIGKPHVETSQGGTINISELESFWKAIWSQEITHNPYPNWMDSIWETTAQNAPMNRCSIDNEIFDKAIKRLHNWKQPGLDKIHNYYYKHLTYLHGHIITFFNNIMTDPAMIPGDMCAGITYLKPKVDPPVSASQYRPITCLNTIYKILTSCIAIRITEYCEDRNIMAEQQKGCRQGTKGCKDQLIIDSVVTNQAIRNRKNLHTAFIDYQKAFDSIPHSWLIKVLHIYGIDPRIIECIRGLMASWVTTLHINEGTRSVISGPIKILRGIYQGDSLSPLLFCLGLNPLSSLLTRSQYGYKLKSTDQHRISHCFYMDDLKLYANTKSNLDKLLEIVQIFTNDIRMQFGIDKCRTQSINKGKYSNSRNFTTTDGRQITQLNKNEHYKYLGFKQNVTIDHPTQKKEIAKELANRVFKIGKSSLNGRNLIKAINTYAIPLLTYTFGIISWSNTDLQDLDRKIRTILTKTKHRHPRSSIERINIPRKYGGRGLLNIEILHNRQVKNLTEYFHRKAATSSLYQAVVSADDNLTPLNLKNNNTVRIHEMQDLITKWESKPLHGKYPSLIHQRHIDFEQTNNWLKCSNMFSETEGFIIAIQDGVVNTRNYRKYIIRDNTLVDDKCRRCMGAPETIPHLLNGCTALVANHYKQRHDNVGKIIYMKVLKHLNIEEQTIPYYRFHPKPITENERYVVYWDRSILIDNPPDTNVPNRPDMVVIDKKEKSAKIIDFAVPYDNNIVETINTKKSKYQQLVEYLKRSQNLNRVEVIPIIISSIGTVPRETTNAMAELKIHLSTIAEIQKAVLIKAVTIMRETLE